MTAVLFWIYLLYLILLPIVGFMQLTGLLVHLTNDNTPIVNRSKLIDHAYIVFKYLLVLLLGIVMQQYGFPAHGEFLHYTSIAYLTIIPLPIAINYFIATKGIQIF